MSGAPEEGVEANIARARSLRGVPGSEYLVSHRSFCELLERQARELGAKEFLSYFDDETGERASYTFAEFDTRVSRLANFFANELGVKRGDAVASLAHNHPYSILVSFACWKLGAIAAPQNMAEDDKRLAFVLNDTECRVVLLLPEYAARWREIAPRVVAVECAVVMDAAFGAALERQPARFTAPAADMREDRALLVYTSGTTGAAKGVMLSQYNLLVACQGIGRWQAVSGDTRFMCVLPVHHVNGLLVTHVLPMLYGASVVLNRSFKVSTFWARLAQQRVHIVSVVPTLLQFLCEARHISTLDLSALRHVVCGAGTLPVALAARFESRFGLRIVHGYGLSEVTAFSCNLPIDLPEPQHRHWMSHYGYPSIGCELAMNEMAIHDAEGRALAPGERGEIVIRGHNVMLGYYKREEANRESFKHGWFRSGDEGFFRSDEQGRRHFFITGRLKELINRGGVKYSPFEIEEALLAIPGVKVGLAIAFDNDWYGEEVGAYVVPKEGACLTEEAVLQACRAALPFGKAPKAVKFGADIPVTATGKWQRLALKELFADCRSIQFKDSRR